MDSLDAQCLIIETIEREMEAPDLWHHRRSGELTCAYSQGETTFTWKTDAVAKMAKEWRESPARAVPERARPFVSTHRRIEEIISDADRGPADAIVHDFAQRELRAQWEADKLVVIIDEIPVEEASA